MSALTAIGIDIGGTGVKAATVDVGAGMLGMERVRKPTPDPPTLERTVATVLDLVAQIPSPQPEMVGVGFPGVIRHGVIETAANLDPSWVGIDGTDLFSDQIGRPTRLINDADAAGLAEVRFGAGRGVTGVVLMITLGTGIGSGLFNDGVLVPNSELGHLDLGGLAAETIAAASAREAKHLSWRRWGERVDRVLREYERLLWPDLIVIGGGVSKRFEKFEAHLHRNTPIVPAALGNNAGIIGAALWAAEQSGT